MAWEPVHEKATLNTKLRIIQKGVIYCKELSFVFALEVACQNDARLQQGGFTMFDIGACYQITLTDKKYYQCINTMQDGNIWGDPRTITLTLDSRF
jgi:hypothetical protein